MKIYLVKDRYHYFDSTDESSYKIKTLGFYHSSQSENEDLVCAKLFDKFMEQKGSSIEECSINLQLSYRCLTRTLTMFVMDPELVLRSLKNNVLCDGNVKVQVTFTVLGAFQNESLGGVKIESKEMKIEGEGGDPLTCIDYTVMFNSPLLTDYLHLPIHGLYGTLNITLSFDESQFVTKPPSISAVNKRILDDKLAPDFLIIPRNGKPVPCHKSFLMARSSVFNSMFQSQVPGRATDPVEIPEMSEESLHAFLAYIYYGDKTQPRAKSLIAFELMDTGGKYAISSLELSMVDILLFSVWHDVDVAVKLFLYSRNSLVHYKVKLLEKALNVLKTNVQDLQPSATFQDLFQESPNIAMELCLYALAA